MMRLTPFRVLAFTLAFATGIAPALPVFAERGIFITAPSTEANFPALVQELTRASLAYGEARGALQKLKNLQGDDEKLQTLLSRTEFPDDPLKVHRERFVTARDALKTALPAVPTGEGAAPESAQIQNARKKSTEAEAVSADESADRALADEAYGNLALAITPAIERLTKEPEAAKDDPAETILRYVRTGESSTQSLKGLEVLAKRLTASKPGLAGDVKAAQGTLATWPATVKAQVTLLNSGLTTAVERLDADLKKEEARWNYPEMGRNLAAARRLREMAIVAADALESANGIFNLKADATLIRTQAQALRPYLELLDDRLGGDRNDWEQTAIPVFYFGSVPRLMTLMNLDAERFENSYFKDVDTGRTALVNAEKQRDLARAEANRLVSELAITRQRLAEIETRSRLDQTNSDRLGVEVVRITDAIAKLDAGVQKTALERQLVQVGDQKKELDARLKSDGAEVTRLQGVRTGLEATRDKLVEELSKARQMLNQMRLESAALAESEVQGFRTGVQRAPFWISRARIGSGDPVKRCEVFGFEDSLIVFVRGNKNDVEAVRDMVRALDRPTPQARLTLHTLQFNGTNPEGMRKATELVESATTQLRGNLTLVQDVLRNAISKEVNRRRRVARSSIYLQNDLVMSERVYRGFYYPREIRDALGLRLRLPYLNSIDDYLNRLGSALDDMKASQALFKLAGERFLAARSLEDRSSRRRAMTDVETALTQAAYLFGKADLDGEVGRFALSPYGSDVSENAYVCDARDRLLKMAKHVTRVYRSDANEGELSEVLVPYLDRNHASYLTNATTVIRVLQGALERDRKLGFGSKISRVAGELDEHAIRRLEFLTRYTLPDPARGTTLGELLFVFSLGGQDSRERILHDFSGELLAAVRGAAGEMSRNDFENFLERAQSLVTKGVRSSGDDRNPLFASAGLAGLAVSSARLYGNSPENVIDAPDGTLFPYFLRTVFGGFSPRDNPGPTSEPMTANQLEILSAIRARVRAGVIEELRARVDANDGLTPDWQAQTLAAYLISNDYLLPYGLEGGVETFKNAGLGAANALSSHQLKVFADKQRKLAGLDEATGRVAAADDMIKRFVTVLEDDLEHFLVAPTLVEIRRSVSGKGIKFGSLQTTSVLAANRGVARYDASAVATLGQDPEAGREALLVGQQLSDLSNTLGGFVGKGAGVAPYAVPLVRSTTHPGTPENELWKLGGLGLLAGALLLPDDNQAPAALYSLTSGGQFKVTPILDPSGQALRFDLDYALTTRVQQPPNSSGLELPLVERQSMNIPVQVSNLDFRRVANFEANTQIGIAPQRFGGVPFFKSLPLFRDIPLIGYFSRSKGTPQVRQQTYVFVQSSIYPTVSDIVGLLVEAPLRSPKARAPEPGKGE